ncbi:kinesin-4 isoform X1 [Cucumis melo var. makuwa]|uniref:Kinesin-4 isoform X1 n=1 Tax=Cucumis melo var. makuwa TaxID=1194695 RepID=A0A5D3CET2_CUCMM|nr:kinesin-4 isoform X1 [Cucumis melo var. makuwa]
MATEQVFPFSVASVVEDVLQQHGVRPRNIDLASKKSEEDSLRRYEAAGWLRKTVGVVGGKDLPAEPSEEEFRLGLRSGIILCNVLNKVQPGAVSKVVEGPCDSVIIPDGAPLSAYQYFENVRNFLVAIEEMGLPTFEASDLEQGGKSTRVVNSVLALKSYSTWKQGGGNGMWKFGGAAKSPTSRKNVVLKNSEPFMNSFTKTSSNGDSFSLESSSSGDNSNDNSNEAGSSRPLHMLLSQLLSNKQLDEIPSIVECMIGKVMEEFENRLATHNNMMKASPEDEAESVSNKSPPQITSADETMEEETTSSPEEISSPEATSCVEEINSPKDSPEATICLEAESFPEAESCPETKVENGEANDQRDEELERKILRRQMLLEQQQKNIEMLKDALGETKVGMQILQMKYQEEFNNLGISKRMHSVAYAASEYRRVLEENRKLYNQVQDLKGNIRVYCRVRPFLGAHSNRPSTVDRIDEGNMSIVTPPKYGKEGRKSFKFNKVFGPSATQGEVFSDTQPLIRSVLDGYNVCIFAYGQTGSGKTYTMSGPTELTEDTLGVNYRALIRNSSQNGINVPDACLVPVSSTSDVINLMNLGQKNRAVSSTAMNDRSSRSHSCLTVHVQGRDLTSGATLRGCMHLVDLAGSERVDKSEVIGDRLKEAQHINKSLSALGDVISSLAQKNAHVPYRNSKLTQLLQDSLGMCDFEIHGLAIGCNTLANHICFNILSGGQAKTLMFVHISPEPEALGETLSTLKFAERVSTVELGAARVNKDSSDAKELKEQIASLKAALVKKDGETEQNSRPSSPEKSRMKTFLSSPSLPSYKSVVEMSVNRTNSLEDVRNAAEAQKQATQKIKRRSLDPRDILKNSPWPPLSATLVNAREDDKESVSSDWDDKVMVNKNSIVRRDETLTGPWDVNNLPETYGQNFLVDPSKVYPENSFNNASVNKKDNQEFDMQRNQYEIASTDDSDDHETVNSETSEPEVIWQSSLPIPKGSSIPNGLGSKIKKPAAIKPAKSPEIRSFIPSLIPSPSRKPQAGIAQPVPKTGKQVVSVEGGKRKGGKY